MVSYRYWGGFSSCFLLFCLIFLGQNNSLEQPHHGETGLLLFTIPGFIASYLASKKRLICPLLGALCALPLCLVVRHFWLMSTQSFWQELAYATSSVFWCLCGALLFLFFRSLRQMLQLRQRIPGNKKGA
ncbi:inner membrane protein YbjM [Serratia sp. Tan611]|uniref:inner membrane protein YbjM n=1 Tax=Serratia sp. Tan611 TaxID=2773264 RepID=UPI0019335C4B|nr:inner membrane protein YbjM [Serratia sp. Tan611]MBU3891514.1 inner membrane protein YbjM [Serratia rubidaea]CAE1144484.1 putative Inner membrane protein YbjM [Serratia sp. Tan611]